MLLHLVLTFLMHLQFNQLTYFFKTAKRLCTEALPCSLCQLDNSYLCEREHFEVDNVHYALRLNHVHWTQTAELNCFIQFYNLLLRLHINTRYNIDFDADRDIWKTLYTTMICLVFNIHSKKTKVISRSDSNVGMSPVYLWNESLTKWLLT